MRYELGPELLKELEKKYKGCLCNACLEDLIRKKDNADKLSI